MLFSSKIFTLLVATVAVSAAPGSSLISSIEAREVEAPPTRSPNPPISALQKVPDVERRDFSSPNPPHKDTNAERLARGLPPVSPRNLWSRTNSARSVSPSQGPPITLHRRIRSTQIEPEVEEQEDTWVKNETILYGELGPTNDETKALHVSITIPSNAVGEVELLNIEIEDPGFDYPYLSWVVGFWNANDNMSLGSSNYAYFANSLETPPNSPAVPVENSFTKATGIPKNAETAVWVYNTETKALYPRWVNTDGSVPVTKIIYYAPDNVYMLTGDYDAFKAVYGQHVSVVAFTLE